MARVTCQQKTRISDISFNYNQVWSSFVYMVCLSLGICESGKGISMPYLSLSNGCSKNRNRIKLMDAIEGNTNLFQLDPFINSFIIKFLYFIQMSILNEMVGWLVG